MSGHRVLTDRECRAATPEARNRKLFDGGGLHLLITPTGFKNWRLKYRFGGKEKQLTFGEYPTVSLKEAREMREEAKRELMAGRDPGRKQQLIRARRTGRVDQDKTFKAAALRWHALQAHGWKAHYATNVKREMEADLFPAIGHMLLADIRRSPGCGCAHLP